MFVKRTELGTRRWAWGTLFILLGLVLVHLSLPRAAAANPHIDLRGPGVKVGDTWLGSYRTFLGEPWAWCVDAGKKSPFAFYDWTSRALAAPQEAYLLHKYAPEATDLNHAALSFILHKSRALPHDAVRPIPPDAPERYGPKLRQRIDALNQEAREFAGPYEVKLTLEEVTSQSFGMASRPENYSLAQFQAQVAVVSARGAAVPQVPVSLRVSGPAVWANGEIELELTSGAKPNVAVLDVAGPGEVTVEMVAKTPPTSVRLYQSDQPAAQRVVSALGHQTQKDRAAVTVTAPVELAISTRASAPEVEVGAEVFDHLDVTIAGGEWEEGLVVPVESTLYGPFDERPELRDAVPQGAPVVAAVTTEVSQPGSWQTPALAVPEPGWYVWHEVVAATEENAQWSAQFGVPEETFRVVAPPSEPAAEPEREEREVPEPEPELKPEPEPELEPEPAPEPASEPEIAPVPEVVTRHENTVAQLPRTGGSLALGLIGGGSLLTGLGTMGAAREWARWGTAGRGSK